MADQDGGRAGGSGKGSGSDSGTLLSTAATTVSQLLTIVKALEELDGVTGEGFDLAAQFTTVRALRR
jgi:hypothetical protein